MSHTLLSKGILKRKNMQTMILCIIFVTVSVFPVQVCLKKNSCSKRKRNLRKWLLPGIQLLLNKRWQSNNSSNSSQQLTTPSVNTILMLWVHTPSLLLRPTRLWVGIFTSTVRWVTVAASLSLVTILPDTARNNTPNSRRVNGNLLFVLVTPVICVNKVSSFPFGSSPFGSSPFGPSLFGPSLFGPSLFGPSLFGPSLFGPSLFGPSLFGYILINLMYRTNSQRQWQEYV